MSNQTWWIHCSAGVHWKILRRLLPASGFRRWTRAPIDVKSTTASNRICWLGDTHRHGATPDQYLSPSVRVPLRTMDGGAAAAGAAGAAVAVAAAAAVAASPPLSARWIAYWQMATLSMKPIGYSLRPISIRFVRFTLEPLLRPRRTFCLAFNRHRFRPLIRREQVNNFLMNECNLLGARNSMRLNFYSITSQLNWKKDKRVLLIPIHLFRAIISHLLNKEEALEQLIRWKQSTRILGKHPQSILE